MTNKNELIIIKYDMKGLDKKDKRNKIIISVIEWHYSISQIKGFSCNLRNPKFIMRFICSIQRKKLLRIPDFFYFQFTEEILFALGNKNFLQNNVFRYFPHL